MHMFWPTGSLACVRTRIYFFMSSFHIDTSLVRPHCVMFSLSTHCACIRSHRSPLGVPVHSFAGRPLSTHPSQLNAATAPGSTSFYYRPAPRVPLLALFRLNIANLLSLEAPTGRVYLHAQTTIRHLAFPQTHVAARAFRRDSTFDPAPTARPRWDKARHPGSTSTSLFKVEDSGGASSTGAGSPDCRYTTQPAATPRIAWPPLPTDSTR